MVKYYANNATYNKEPSTRNNAHTVLWLYWFLLIYICIESIIFCFLFVQNEKWIICSVTVPVYCGIIKIYLWSLRKLYTCWSNKILYVIIDFFLDLAFCSKNIKCAPAGFALVTVKPNGTAVCLALTSLILQRLTVVSHATFIIYLFNNAVFFLHSFPVNSQHILVSWDSRSIFS